MPTLASLQEQIDRLRRCCKKQIFLSDADLTGEVPCGYTIGINYINGNFFFKNDDCEWEAIPCCGEGGTGNTIYTADDSLIDDRTVNGNDNFLKFINTEFHIVGNNGLYRSNVSPFTIMLGDYASTGNGNLIAVNDTLGELIYNASASHMIEINNTAIVSVTSSGIDIDGGVTANIITVSSNYAVIAQDLTILVNATGGNRTITLPAAASNNGRVLNIKKIDASGNTVTIDGNASETIDGATTQVITTQWTSYQIQSDGSAWYIL